VDRIHRIGQCAGVVRVRRFLVEGTVEERMVGLQRRKLQVAGSVLGDGEVGGGEGHGNPTLEDFKAIFGRGSGGGSGGG